MSEDMEVYVPGVVSALETKAHVPATAEEPGLGEFFGAFEEFKRTNDVRLKEIEKRGTSDVLVEEKLRRLEQGMDGLQRELLDSRRPALGDGDRDFSGARSSAIEAYVRKGRTDDLELLEEKGLSIGSEADGGYLVSPEMEMTLANRLREDSPVRALAKSIRITTSAFKRPFVKSGAGAGWTGETSSRPETSTPQLAELSFPAMELYAMPSATKQMLDDGAVDVGQWLIDELHTSFEEKETEAFISGDGLSAPKGILSYPRQASANPTFGNIGKVSTGVSGGFDNAKPADCLYDIVHSVPQRYRKNGAFLMHRLTLSTVRRIKDENGDYIFQPRLSDGLEMRLLGYPVAECDSMPEVAANSASLVFGDFNRGYLIVDRQGVQIMRDPYSAKPYVLFYATKRVGGGVADFSALRVLVFSA